jgi:hypothetical protein
MNLGFNKPLYIQPFDHRASFQTKMFGWKGALNEEQTAAIAAAKQVIYDGFKAAVAGSRFRRVCRRSHRFLGTAGCLARKENFARSCRRGDCAALPDVCGCV